MLNKWKVYVLRHFKRKKKRKKEYNKVWCVFAYHGMPKVLLWHQINNIKNIYYIIGSIHWAHIYTLLDFELLRSLLNFKYSRWRLGTLAWTQILNTLCWMAKFSWNLALKGFVWSTRNQCNVLLGNRVPSFF